MSWVIDVLLVALLVAYAIRGWRVGFVATVLELLGLSAGLMGALVFGPRLLVALGLTGAKSSLVLIALIFFAMVVGEVIVGRVGHMVREANNIKVLHRADTALGAVASMMIMLIAAWFCTAAIKPVAPQLIGKAIDDSLIVQGLDEVLPGRAARFAAGMTRTLDAAGFPTVFSGLEPEPKLPVDAPDPAVVNNAKVKAAAASVVRVMGAAPACDRRMSGSGWVSSKDRVVTNAHVVAGATEVTVQIRGVGRVYKATVVVFNPQLDLAILEVKNLPVKPLAMSNALEPGTSVVAAGFPLGDSYRVEAGRIRGTLSAVGEDIYGTPGVRRSIYSVRTTIVPGNSGGPLLTEHGEVAGTVFARSITDTATGYALTNAATRAHIERGATDTTAASTGACTRR